MIKLALVKVYQQIYHVSDAFEISGVYGTAEKLYEIGSSLEEFSKEAYALVPGALEKIEELNADIIEMSLSLELIGNYISSDLLKKASMDLDAALVSFPEDLKELAKNSTEITTEILTNMMK